jgi:uncharacterized protein
LRLYFDTSIFVPLTVAEQKSEAIQNWFSGCDPSSIVVSDWVMVEFRSALSLKLRTRQITTAARDASEKVLLTYISDYFTTVAVQRADFQRAAALAHQESLKLRAGDALHLAIAERLELELATLDGHLHDAATAIGIRAFRL